MKEVFILQLNCHIPCKKDKLQKREKVRISEEGSRQKDPIETQLLTRGLQATHELGGLNVEVQN